VTLLNAAIFIGGSVYTGISVTSIQEKYAKAQGEIEKVRLDQEVQELRASVSNRGASWLSLRSAFYQGNWVLKLYLIMVPLCALATLALVARVTGFY